MDVEAPKTRKLHHRSPFLEVNCLFPGEVDKELLKKVGIPENVVKDLDSMPEEEVRVIKTHLPFEFLPPNLLDVAKGQSCEIYL